MRGLTTINGNESSRACVYDLIAMHASCGNNAHALTHIAFAHIIHTHAPTMHIHTMRIQALHTRTHMHEHRHIATHIYAHYAKYASVRTVTHPPMDLTSYPPGPVNRSSLPLTDFLMLSKTSVCLSYETYSQDPTSSARSSASARVPIRRHRHPLASYLGHSHKQQWGG